MRLVTLESLNDLRYQDNPVPLNRLRHWCRLGVDRGGIPALKQGREWMVDLEAFDKHCHDQVASTTNTLATTIRRRVVELGDQGR